MLRDSLSDFSFFEFLRCKLVQKLVKLRQERSTIGFKRDPSATKNVAHAEVQTAALLHQNLAHCAWRVRDYHDCAMRDGLLDFSANSQQ